MVEFGFSSYSLLILLTFDGIITVQSTCPQAEQYGTGPSSSCKNLTDPNNKPKSSIESWFTEKMFNDLFPKANLGWGPNKCFPYSYESFIIAARYFPRFGTEAGTNYTTEQNARRDLAAFFAHAIQETGENDVSLYTGRSQSDADDCFYRGGFYNWFEGGPQSSLMPSKTAGSQLSDGEECLTAGRYCESTEAISYFYPCGNETNGTYYKSCYFGRGAIQLSYNYNYGQFQDWLKTQNISVDLLKEPNLLMTKTDPPLAILASLWFYMTPQPPKPAMHDIVIGNWNPGTKNKASGYSGAIFGPTSLVINNECTGEDSATPGNAGENRRIKAFRWFTNYFDVQPGANNTLTCKGMPQTFDSMTYNVSYQPDYTSTWKSNSQCKCAPALYSGTILYYDPDYYPEEYVKLNEVNAKYCQKTLYKAPSIYSLTASDAPCLNNTIS